MAFALTVGDLSVKKGSYTILTTSNVNLTDSVAADYFIVSTPPTNGTLALNGVALAANDTFTLADVTAGLVSYEHDASVAAATGDTFGLQAYDSVGDTTVLEDASTVTVTDNYGWVAVVFDDVHAMTIAGMYDQEKPALDYVNNWLAHNAGRAEALTVSTGNNILLGTWFTAGTKNRDLSGGNMQQLNDAERKQVDIVAQQIVHEMANDSEYTALSALIGTNGPAINSMQLTTEQKRLLNRLRDHNNPIPLKHNRTVFNPWNAVMWRVKELLNA